MIVKLLSVIPENTLLTVIFRAFCQQWKVSFLKEKNYFLRRWKYRRDMFQSKLAQGGREHCTLNYTGTQIFITMLSHSLDKNFNWLVPNFAINNIKLQKGNLV